MNSIADLHDPPYTMNGTMVTEFLATLNRAPCFTNHCDWRIPNVKELQSIVDYEIPFPGPTVNAAVRRATMATSAPVLPRSPLSPATSALPASAAARF